MSNETMKDDKRAAFKAWFDAEWNAYLDKAFTDKIIAKAWALKAWRASAASQATVKGDEAAGTLIAIGRLLSEAGYAPELRIIDAVREVIARAATPQADESELAKKDRTIAFLRDQNRRIISAADAIRNDADRYRWLRERAWYVDAATYALELRERWRDGDTPPPDADEIEQALDIARKTEIERNDRAAQTDTKS